MALQIDDERLAMRIELVRRGMTQRRLADAVGIDARALSDYLLGRRDLPAEVVEQIRQALAAEA